MENSHYSHTLHQCHVHKLWATLNRTYGFLNLLAIGAILYYRISFFFNKTNPNITFIPWILTFVTELLVSFMWVLKQSFYWRPVTRTVFPERLPKNEELLQGIDVFICTADPIKEPTLEVMNTVISAMTLDYPANKLSVYLSDDGGANVTLKGMKEAWVFATWWLPFCKRYNVKPICPQAYFEKPEVESHSKDFIEEKKMVEEKYEIFKQRVWSITERGKIDGHDDKTSARNHPPLVQVINENSIKDEVENFNKEYVETMPLLVYVAREKRPSHRHNFKAGALNVLIRVSSMLSNSPYILVLDCDMYCNDSISAREAMCFFLDPKISASLGWVQYPQKFHNISESDIYDSQMRTIWPVLWPGIDGIQGPLISGTNLYIKRKAFYGDIDDDNDIKELRASFGPSYEFMKSLSQNYKPNAIKDTELPSDLLQEAQSLASCTYEKDTKWGQKHGYRYDTVVEDVMTSFMLQSKGWRSVYLNPKRPQFLGSATTNLNELLIQGIRWNGGLLSLGLSKYCPLIYGPSNMHILQKMSYSWVTLYPLDFLPVLCFSTIPPLCFLYGIPLYPMVSNPFFIAFAFAFISSRLKHIYEVHISGGSIMAWINEERTGMMKIITSYVYGTLDCVLTKLGFREAKFTVTNKAEDKDTTKWYQMGKYDFRTSNMFIIPIVTIVTLNLSCFIGGVARVIVARNWDAMFAQVCLSIYVFIMSFPVLEGMLLRKDKASISLSTTLKSIMLSMVFLSLGYFILLH